jgi:hypothetical protein
MRNTIIDQNKAHRTPVQTMVILLKNGYVDDVFYLLVRKFKTLLGLLVWFYRVPIKIIQRQPTISRWLKKRHLRLVLQNTFNFSPKMTGDDYYKIALVVSHGETRPSSSAFIRLIAPLTNEGFGNNYELHIFSEQNYKLDQSYDVCIIQRAVFKTVHDANILVRKVQQNNIRLVVDSDDGFHAIDSTHNEFTVHTSRLDAFNTILARADEVWLSTKRLAQSYKEHSQKIHIIPNTLDPRLWQSKNTNTTVGGVVRFLYMGTATHDEDFKLILPALEELAKKHPKSFTLDVIGVSDSVKETNWLRILPQVRGSMYPDFVAWYLEQGPFDYGLSPLVDSAFNRSKSDIKCLDYLAAGIIPVVSDIEPYRAKELQEFIIKVSNNSDSWIKALESLILNVQEDKQKNIRIITEANSYIQTKRSSSVAAQVIKERIEKLVSG